MVTISHLLLLLLSLIVITVRLYLFNSVPYDYCYMLWSLTMFLLSKYDDDND